MEHNIGHDRRSRANKSTIQVIAIVCMILSLSAINVLPTAAQVPPITPSGLNTSVNLPSNPPSGKVQYDITGGTRPGGGTNLFHSFGNFNVPNNNIANFLNDSGLPTSNILGRVTGGNVSNIFGTIQTNGFGNANLFLMNPAGFLFGPNATLNVGGMVAFTSADYLRLTDGKLFNASPNAIADQVLSTAPVASYGFLGSNPGAITVQGSQLSITPAQSLSLVGGNITIQSGTLADGTLQPARLAAPGGQINLASVASPGEISAGTLAQSPNINGQSFGDLGTIRVSEQSVIDVSGNGGGSVLIRGGQFVLDSSTISGNTTGPGPFINGVESIGAGIDIQVSQNATIQNGALLETNILADVTPGKTYGGVQVKADHIEIASNFPFPLPLGQGGTGIRSDVQATDLGANGGNITLEANSITIRGNAIIEADVNGSPLPPSPSTTRISNAGDITVTANQDILLNGSTFQSRLNFDSGTAGSLTVMSKHGSIIESGAAFPPGFTINPGDPIPPPPVLNVVFNQSFLSTGKPGNVTFSAPEGDITLAGAIMNIQVSPAPMGPPALEGGGGQLHLNANNIQLINNSFISVDNFSTLPAGAFTVAVNDNLTLNSSRIVTTARGPAQAAQMDITAHDVVVTNGAVLSTQTANTGSGGPLSIIADTVQITNGAQITSRSVLADDPFTGQPLTTSGAGGTISIQGLNGSARSVLIDGSNSGIFTNTDGTGSAGNMNISAQSLSVQNGGTISAETSGIAPTALGGNITLSASQLTLNRGGTITASASGPANAGSVTVQGLPSMVIDGSGSGIFSEANGTGAGGNISVNASSITISNSGAVSASTSGSASSATGGSITFNASNGINLASDSSITASSSGLGNAGNIVVDAGPQLVMQDSGIKTEAAQAGGGNIDIRAVDLVQLGDSTISTSVLGGGGSGGNITIDPNAVVLQNSQILAQAVQGSGGNISITTNLLLPDSASIIDASSQFGQQGNIVIQSPVSPASGKIIPLGQKPLIATALLSQRCAALAGGNASSFTVAGRDSLPAEPGGWVPSPLALSMAESNEGTATETPLSSFMEIEEGTPLLSLRKIAPAGFLTQSFGAASSDCQS
jgi:filamentous hemagglutinin family protein